MKASAARPVAKAEAGERRNSLCDVGSKAIPGGSRFAIRRDAASRTAKPLIGAGERAFFYPSDQALYGARCGHGDKAQRDFTAHQIDEDGY